MALTQRLDLRQAQTLVMTPQLHALKLLQLSTVELSEFVDREIEQNPLLERDDGDRPAGDGGEAGLGMAEPDSTPELPPAPDGRTRDTVEMTSSETMGSASDAPLDTDFENDYADDRFSDGGAGSAEVYGQWNERGGRGFEDDDSNFEARLTGDKSLRDHLIEQLNIDLSDPADRLIGLALIDTLDEAGWLTADLEAMAEQLGTDLAHVERVLAVAQRFRPPGIFARPL